jgi:hypothetical protein
VRLAATVKVNESMNHFAALLPDAYSGGFNDGHNLNNEAVDRISASTPPTLSGSRKIKLRGIPTGCATGDFTLRASTKVRGVKKWPPSVVGLRRRRRRAGMEEGREGEAAGCEGAGLSPGPGTGRNLQTQVKAKRGGDRALKLTVTFTLC